MGDMQRIDTEQVSKSNVISLPVSERRPRTTPVADGEEMGKIILFMGVRYERMSSPQIDHPEPAATGSGSPRRRRR